MIRETVFIARISKLYVQSHKPDFESRHRAFNVYRRNEGAIPLRTPLLRIYIAYIKH